jgi:diaphanous 1
MPDSSLTVPTILTTGTLHFVSVKPDGTAQDVIDSLVALDEVNSDILGDLDEAGWALQKIRWEESGRIWDNDELEAIGDGKRALSCYRCHIV